MAFLEKTSRITARYTKHTQNMYVGDIGHPDLVYGGYFKSFNEIWIDLKAVVAVGCGNPLFLSGSA